MANVSEIKTFCKMEDTKSIEDLVNQVSLLNLIPESKEIFVGQHDIKFPLKSEDNGNQTSIDEKESNIIEESLHAKEKITNKFESTYIDKSKTTVDTNENVIEPELKTSVNKLAFETNNLTLEDYETDTDTSDDDGSESEEATTRGPDIPKKNYFHTETPYSRPQNTPNTFSGLLDRAYLNQSQNINFDFNILPNSLTENVTLDTSQLFLSGGGVVLNDSTDETKIINDIKEALKSPEIYDRVNNTSSNIINFDDLEDYPSPDISLLDEEELRNNIEEFIMDKSDTSSVNCSTPSSFSNFSDVSSPVSSYGDQEVYSPSSSYPEQTPTPTLYFIENSLSPKMQNVNNECFTFTEICFMKNINGDAPKQIPILPKLDFNKINSTVMQSSNIKINRATGPRNIHLSHISKKTKDLYHKKILKLLDEGLLIKSKDGHTFLQTAILCNQPNFAVYLAHLMKLWINKSPKPKGLESVEDIETFVNSCDNEGRTALYISTLYNQPNVCGFLFEECNANIEIADKEGQTPLHIACQSGEKYLKIVQIFTKEKSKINLEMLNLNGRTPLHEAVHCHSKILNGKTMEKINNLSIVQHLLSSGAKVDVVDKYGLTPIHLAVKNRSIDMLEKLHDFGVLCGFDDAINIKDNNSKTAFDMVCSEEYNPGDKIEIGEKLLSYGAILN